MGEGLFKVDAGSACNPVKIGATNRLFGDPKIKLEKPHTIILFPGGSVEIARTSEGLYWAHIAVRAEPGEPSGTIVSARLDARGRYADPANEALRSEIAEGDVEHIAFLIQPPTPSKDKADG